MKELTKEDLLNAVATYNADPYCVENEEMAEELYNDIIGNYEEIEDISDAIEAAWRLDIKSDMQVRHIYQFNGGYFVLNKDIIYTKDALDFSEAQWKSLMNFEPGLFINYCDLSIIAAIANRWFSSYQIKESQIWSLADLGNAIIAGKINKDEVADICKGKIGWIKCEGSDYDDSDIAIDLISSRGKRLRLIDDGFEVVENSREIKYEDYWVNVREDWQNYYIEFQDGDREGVYPKDSFTLGQALDAQLSSKKENFYSNDDKETIMFK